MELTVILLFIAAFWRLALIEATVVEVGHIYALFAYLWKYVLALDHVPQVTQQIAKLRDINARIVKGQM